MESKVCKACGQRYPATLEFFYRTKDNRDRLTTLCKKCSIKRVQKYWETHKEKRREGDKNCYQKNKEKRLKQFKEKGKKRNEVLKALLGVSYDKLHSIMKKKVPKPKYCTICNEKKKLELCCIDHNYSYNALNWIWLCILCHRLFDKCRKKIGGYA